MHTWITNTHHTHHWDPFPTQGTPCTTRNTQHTEEPNTDDTHHTHNSAIHSTPKTHTKLHTDTTHQIQHTDKTLLPQIIPHTSKHTHRLNRPQPHQGNHHKPQAIAISSPHTHPWGTHLQHNFHAQHTDQPIPPYHKPLFLTQTCDAQKSNTSTLPMPSNTTPKKNLQTPQTRNSSTHGTNTAPTTPQTSSYHRQNTFPKTSFRPDTLIRSHSTPESWLPVVCG